jgi:hypothetical protein
MMLILEYLFILFSCFVLNLHSFRFLNKIFETSEKKHLYLTLFPCYAKQQTLKMETLLMKDQFFQRTRDPL